MANETDSIPRIKMADLFLILHEFEREASVTLERLRCLICVNRKQKLGGDLNWSIARDNAIELHRLGFLEANSFPKDRKAYERMKNKQMGVTIAGKELLSLFRSNRGAAYDELFKAMYKSHPYLRSFVRAISQQRLIVPVITSFKEHISPKYGSAKQLSDDVSIKHLETDMLLSLTEKRIQRSLTSDEVSGISSGIQTLLEESAYSSIDDEPIEFAKKFLSKLNDIVLPNIFAMMDLRFDYRTHRTLWAFGQVWKTWQATSAHPDYGGRLVYRTATIRLVDTGDIVEDLIFDSGLKTTEKNFLFKLFQAYQKLEGTYVPAWALRAVFCFDNTCQDSVFDTLMETHYTDSGEYEVQLETHYQKGQHDRPLVIGNRNIGLVRVVRKQP